VIIIVAVQKNGDCLCDFGGIYGAIADTVQCVIRGHLGGW
jgi:hypothetical protein